MADWLTYARAARAHWFENRNAFKPFVEKPASYQSRYSRLMVSNFGDRPRAKNARRNLETLVYTIQVFLMVWPRLV